MMRRKTGVRAITVTLAAVTASIAGNVMASPPAMAQTTGRIEYYRLAPGFIAESKTATGFPAVEGASAH